jgi:hypothetical protein
VAPARRAVLVLGLAAILLGAAAASRRDLGGDESRGGHTLARHVGRTDSQLLDRLAREPRISAASTYTDRATRNLWWVLRSNAGAERPAAGFLRADILSGGTRVSPTERSPYPQLEAFFAGYLNQDFPETYGDVAGAVRAFAADASATERQALAREWQAFREDVGEDVTVTSLGRTLASRFGSAWAPRRRAELDHLDRLIRALGSRA